MKPAFNCPSCGYWMDDATAVDGPEDAEPSEGDLAVCLKCGHILVYTADGGCKEPDLNDFMKLAESDRAKLFTVSSMLKDKRYERP